MYVPYKLKWLPGIIVLRIEFEIFVYLKYDFDLKLPSLVFSIQKCAVTASPQSLPFGNAFLLIPHSATIMNFITHGLCGLQHCLYCWNYKKYPSIPMPWTVKYRHFPSLRLPTNSLLVSTRIRPYIFPHNQRSILMYNYACNI